MTGATEGGFSDVRLTDEQAARTAGVSLSTFHEMVAERRGPYTNWKSDVVRWTHSLKAGHR